MFETEFVTLTAWRSCSILARLFSLSSRPFSLQYELHVIREKSMGVNSVISALGNLFLDNYIDMIIITHAFNLIGS